LALALAVATAQPHPAPWETQDGAPAWKGVLDPVGPFDVRDLHGKRWTDKDFAGRILVVRLWSAHCGPCVADFPQVQQFYESVRHRTDLAFITLNLDAPTPQLGRFLHDLDGEYSFPVLFGRSYFKILAMPYTWVVDAQGYVRDVYSGAGSDWREDTLRRVEAVKHKLPISALPAGVREQQRRRNELEGAKAVQLTN
jgi:cytochrome oxidase Cu insertion factor (SCO1/SenC/PrrC family)